MTASRLDTVYTDAMYTKDEVAKILAAPASTVHAWLSGYNTARKTYAPVVDGVGFGRGPQVSFTGLAETFVLNAFRKAGLPLQRIRPAVDILKNSIGLEHALASRRLVTDGAEILITSSDRGDQRLMVVRNGQAVFNEVVQGYLRHIEFGDSGYASAIELPQFTDTPVIVRPLLNGGRPTMARRGVAIEDVLGRVRAGEPPVDVAEDYRMTVADILYLNYAAA